MDCPFCTETRRDLFGLSLHIDDAHAELREWCFRPDDWWEIWPELIGTKGAPRVIAKAA